MRDGKWIKLDELRQPGSRRILEAMRLIEQEAPGLIDKASFAAAELQKSSTDGGRVPE
jgi:hypothetical protein